MTVGIGAVARSGGAIVLVADRLLTYDPYGAALTGEAAASKMTWVHGDWHALFAGSATFSLGVVGAARAAVEAPEGAPVVGALKDAYDRMRHRIVVDTVLAPRLLTEDLYLARPNTLAPLDTQYRAEINAEIQNFRFPCELLVAGFEKGVGVLVSITDAPLDYHFQGFATIGSGGNLALADMLWSEVHPDDDIDVVLYYALAAKFHAEMTAFVGHDSDAWILLPGKKIISVPRGITKLIELVFSKYDRGPFSHRKEWEERPGWERPDPVPKDWEKQLKDYVDEVAGKWR